MNFLLLLLFMQKMVKEVIQAKRKSIAIQKVVDGIKFFLQIIFTRGYYKEI